MSEKRLENLLNPNDDGGLGEIVRHAREMGDLVKLLQMSLSPQESGAIVAANIRDDGELVVLAASPAWASRLRFQTDELMEAAREAGSTIVSCTVRVARSGGS